MFCRNCGSEVRDGAQFCRNCGCKIEKSQTAQSQRSVVQNAAGKKQNPKAILGAVLGGVAVAAVVLLIGVRFILPPSSNSDIEDTYSQNDTAATAGTDDSLIIPDVEAQEAEHKTAQESQPETFFADSPPQDSAPTEDMIPQEEPVSEYILQDSDSRYLTKEDLQSLNAEECRLARNEIYARYGRKFDDEGLQSYFSACSWYQGTMEPADFQESMLNEFEIANRDLIVAYEKEMGYR